MIILVALLTLILSTDLFAATRYVAQDGSDSNSCAQSETITTPKLTFASALSCLSAGDTLYIRGGTWTQQLDLQAANKTGTPGNYITIGGYPGETVIIRFTDPSVYGPIKVRGARSYFLFQDLTLDGINQPLSSGWAIRDGNHHFILRRLIIENQNYHGLYISANDITVEDSIFRNGRAPVNQTASDCTPGFRHLGWYIHDGSRIVMRRNKINNMPGGGGQHYPGPFTDGTLVDNEITDNGWCTTTDIGGWILQPSAVGGNASNMTFSGNLIHANGNGGNGGAGGGLRIDPAGGATITGLKVNNNTIYNNQTKSGSTQGYGINIQGNTSGEVKNNLVVANEIGQIRNDTTGTITTATNRTTGTITDCTVSPTDLRLKQGANSCRDAGTAVTTRPSPVGVTDIGAFEQGLVSSATVADGFIELTISAMSGIQPTSGLTGLTLICGTCTGTPVLTGALKAGSTNIVQVSASGLTGSGTGTINLGSTNMRDSSYVGPTSNAYSQGINSVSTLTVNGTITNTGDPTPEPGGLFSEYLLKDGSGTSAADTSGNANTGTVSTGVTWISDGAGVLDTGIYIPTAEEAGDSTYRHVVSPHGAGVNVAANSLSYCILAKPDLQVIPTVIGSSGDNSSNRRAYVGVTTIGGATFWGQGVQASSFTASGVTEFPAVQAPTLVCQRFNAATNTANLSVDGVIGTSAAANKTYTDPLTLADNIRAGNDGTFSVNTGGLTVYAMWVWNNTYISDAQVQALHASLVPAGGSVGGYAQVTHRWQRVYLDGPDGTPINYLDIGDEEIDVVENGAVVIEKEVACSGGPCAAVAFRLFVADLAGNEAPVPQAIGAGGIGLWGASTSNILNRGVSACCLTEGGTAVDGVTILDSAATNTVELCDGCKTMFRWVLRVGEKDKTHILFLRQDNGAPLDGVAGTSPRIRVVASQAAGVH